MVKLVDLSDYYFLCSPNGISLIDPKNPGGEDLALTGIIGYSLRVNSETPPELLVRVESDTYNGPQNFKVLESGPKV